MGGGEDRVDDGSASGTSDTVIVRFPDTADGSDVVLDEEVLSEICTKVLAMPLLQGRMHVGTYH